MILPVARISPTVFSVLRPPFASTVHSVFRRAVNIRHGARLVTLLPESAPGAVNGVYARVPGGLSYRAAGIAPGTTVRAVAAGAASGTGGAGHATGEGEDLALDLSGARCDRFDGRIGRLAVRPGLPHRLARAVRAGRALSAERSGGGFGALWETGGPWGDDALPHATAERRDPVCARAAVSVRRLAGAVGMKRPDEAVAAAVPLLGLGPGLTPSGDDLLVGLFAALWAVEGRIGLGGPASERLLAEAGRRTNAVSFTYLSYALEGWFSEPLHRLATRLAAGTPEEVERALAALGAQGATSGLDTALGAVIGFAAATAEHIGRITA